MVKLKGPLFSVGAHGTLGEVLSFQDGVAGPRAMIVPKHRDMYSTGQSRHRASFVSCVSLWNALSAASKAYYNGLAAKHCMTGYNWYLKGVLTGVSGGGGGGPSLHTGMFEGRMTAEDCDCKVYWNGSAWAYIDAGALNGGVGYYLSGGFKFGSGWRWVNVTIPVVATITAAYIACTSEDSQSSNTVRSKIIGDKEANAAVWTTLANYQGRRGTAAGGANNNLRTAAEVAWDSIGAWGLNSVYNSPDISSVIQEIVGQGGWASGNALALFWDDHEARGTQSDLILRNAFSYGGSPSKSPLLHVEYEYYA